MKQNDCNITYCQADETDIEIITELLCELYEELSYEVLLNENKLHFSDGKQKFFLAFCEKRAVGVCHGSLRTEYVNGKVYDGTVGYLEAIYVNPVFRLKGIAAELVSKCEDWAYKNGCKEFLSDCLLDNTDSYKFHSKIGFSETERCIFFRKDLVKKCPNKLN